MTDDTNTIGANKDNLIIYVGFSYLLLEVIAKILQLTEIEIPSRYLFLDENREATASSL